MSNPEPLPNGETGQILGPGGIPTGTWQTSAGTDKDHFFVQLTGGYQVTYARDQSPNSDNYYYERCEFISGTFHGYGSRFCFSDVGTQQGIFCSFVVQTLDDNSEYENTENGSLKKTAQGGGPPVQQGGG